MMYKAKVAVCSEIHTKHSKQSEQHVEFLNFKPWWYGKKPLGFKRLNKETDVSETDTDQYDHSSYHCASKMRDYPEVRMQPSVHTYR